MSILKTTQKHLFSDISSSEKDNIKIGWLKNTSLNKFYNALLIFLLLGVAGVGIFFLSTKENWKNIPTPKQFVTLKSGHFSVNDSLFYPLVLNYKVSLKGSKEKLWPSSYVGYKSNPEHQYFKEDSCRLELKAEMQLIKEMGFNTLRIVGIGETECKVKSANVSIKYVTQEGREELFALDSLNNFTIYLNALAKVFQAAEAAELKVILLLQMEPHNKSYQHLLKQVASRFKNNSTLMAYDLFNEPLYFDSIRKRKKEIHHIVRKWNTIQKMYAPHQLSTIGLAGIREIFRWDPNILNVDFISYHPYEYEPDQVRNEIYWYSKYTEKPWIIGETAIPADNDSVPYEKQTKFAKKTLQQAFSCGAIGYSWWQYKEVDWATFYQNHLGVLSQKGRTKVGDFYVYGTVKPVANVFKNFNPHRPKSEPVFLPNYYNYSQHHSFCVKGKIVDQEGQPIQGAVILGWNQWWSNSYHTITKADGTFRLLSDFKIYHWMASATKKQMIRGDFDPNNAQQYPPDTIPTINLGTLQLGDLDFW